MKLLSFISLTWGGIFSSYNCISRWELLTNNKTTKHCISTWDSLASWYNEPQQNISNSMTRGRIIVAALDIRMSKTLKCLKVVFMWLTFSSILLNAHKLRNSLNLPLSRLLNNAAAGWTDKKYSRFFRYELYFNYVKAFRSHSIKFPI